WSVYHPQRQSPRATPMPAPLSTTGRCTAGVSTTTPRWAPTRRPSSMLSRFVWPGFLRSFGSTPKVLHRVQRPVTGRAIAGGAAAGLRGVVQLSMGFLYACALREDCTVWCWGENDDHRLGVGDLPGGARVAPVPLQVRWP